MFVDFEALRRYDDHIKVNRSVGINGVYDALVIVGLSCSGKTSIINSIREKKENKFHIPKRVTTREMRNNDDGIENEFINNNQFQERIKNRQFLAYWKREMGEDNIWYGFENHDNVKGYLLSGNAQLSKDNSNVCWANINPEKVIFIGLSASSSIRRKRFIDAGRSRTMKEAEVKYRLNLEEEKYNVSDTVDIIIRTDRKDPSFLGSAILDFIKV